MKLLNLAANLSDLEKSRKSLFSLFFKERIDY